MIRAAVHSSQARSAITQFRANGTRRAFCRETLKVDGELARSAARGDDLPSASQRSLPAAEAVPRCELCGDRPRAPLSSVLVIDGPDGLPVPFLICAHCRRALAELRSLLESAEATAT